MKYKWVRFQHPSKSTTKCTKHLPKTLPEKQISCSPACPRSHVHHPGIAWQQIEKPHSGGRSWSTVPHSTWFCSWPTSSLCEHSPTTSSCISGNANAESLEWPEIKSDFFTLNMYYFYTLSYIYKWTYYFHLEVLEYKVRKNDIIVAQTPSGAFPRKVSCLWVHS